MMKVDPATLRRTSADNWTIELQFIAPDEQSAQRRARAIAAIIETARAGHAELPLHPHIDDSWTVEHQLNVTASYARQCANAGAAGFLYFVLLALRSGQLEWIGQQWKGSTALLSRHPDTSTKGSVSKAATVLRDQLPHLLSSKIPTTEAFTELAGWLATNNWTQFYGPSKFERRS